MEGSADRTIARVPSRRALRKLWLWPHRWLGLVLGLWFSIIGLTGSILVFHAEIDEALNAALQIVEMPPAGRYQPADKIFAAAREALPPSAVMAFITYPRDERGVYAIDFSVPSPGGDETWRVYVDPYRAAVTGKTLVRSATDWWPHGFVPFVFELHYSLLVFGMRLVGYIAVAMLVSLLLGIVRVKRGAPPQRFVYDLHKTIGLCSAVVLGALIISGLYFNLSETFNWVVRQFSPATVNLSELQSVPITSGKPLTLGHAMVIADSKTPGGHFSWMVAASMPEDVHIVCKAGIPAINRFVDQRCFVIDQWSGKILHVGDTVSGSAGDAFLAWQLPLHSGQAFGWPGRILVFMVGLACPAIFATGLLRWLHKRRARQAAAEA
jgi:uncharacterized iron-regulated membrane protein